MLMFEDGDRAIRHIAESGSGIPWRRQLSARTDEQALPAPGLSRSIKRAMDSSTYLALFGPYRRRHLLSLSTPKAKGIRSASRTG